jgi:peptide/nickel transport system ATP-binding protein
MRCVMPSTPAIAELASAQPLLRVAGLSVSFATPVGTVRAVDEVSFAVERGECLAVLGESGAGKTQLFLALLGLLSERAHVTGSARFAGSELIGAGEGALERLRGAGIGMVFQDPSSALTPHLTVGAQLSEAVRRHAPLSRRAAGVRALELCKRVHLSDPARRLSQYPHELSGGMRQRVMIALALSCAPQLLIADEPTTSLDVTLQGQILALLAELRAASGLTLVLITHDLSAVAALAGRVVVMRHGRIIEAGAVRELWQRPREPYTQRLLAEARALGKPPAAPPATGCAPAPALLSVAGLTVRYGVRRHALAAREELTALKDVSLELRAGEALGIVGESGCGKSTLARAALALIKSSAGRVLWLGSAPAELPAGELRALRREVQLIFQDPFGSLDPRLTVAELIAEPLTVHEGALSVAARRTRVAASLERVGLGAEFLERYAHQLSGGQCQRVGIARAMVLNPRVLVCDEPLSALDVSTQEQIVTLLGALHGASGGSLIFISHNLALVRRLCGRVLVLYLGRMMELAPTAALFAHANHPYTQELLAAIPRVEPAIQPGLAARLYGAEPPSPLNPPSGCVYRTRCALAVARCASEVPAWEALDAERRVACHRWRELA